eukprot:g3917.t1
MVTTALRGGGGGEVTTAQQERRKETTPGSTAASGVSAVAHSALQRSPSGREIAEFGNGLGEWMLTECIRVLSTSAEERFTKVFPHTKWSILENMDALEFRDWVNAALEAATKLIQDFVIFALFLEPCFPPKYRIFETLSMVYDRLFTERLRPLMLSADLQGLLQTSSLATDDDESDYPFYNEDGIHQDGIETGIPGSHPGFETNQSRKQKLNQGNLLDLYRWLDTYLQVRQVIAKYREARKHDVAHHQKKKKKKNAYGEREFPVVSRRAFRKNEKTNEEKQQQQQRTTTTDKKKVGGGGAGEADAIHNLRKANEYVDAFWRLRDVIAARVSFVSRVKIHMRINRVVARDYGLQLGATSTSIQRSFDPTDTALLNTLWNDDDDDNNVPQSFSDGKHNISSVGTTSGYGGSSSGGGSMLEQQNYFVEEDWDFDEKRNDKFEKNNYDINQNAPPSSSSLFSKFKAVMTLNSLNNNNHTRENQTGNQTHNQNKKKNANLFLLERTTPHGVITSTKGFDLNDEATLWFLRTPCFTRHILEKDIPERQYGRGVCLNAAEDICLIITQSIAVAQDAFGGDAIIDEDLEEDHLKGDDDDDSESLYDENQNSNDGSTGSSSSSSSFEKDHISEDGGDKSIIRITASAWENAYASLPQLARRHQKYVKQSKRKGGGHGSPKQSSPLMPFASHRGNAGHFTMALERIIDVLEWAATRQARALRKIRQAYYLAKQDLHSNELIDDIAHERKRCSSTPLTFRQQPKLYTSEQEGRKNVKTSSSSDNNNNKKKKAAGENNRHVHRRTTTYNPFTTHPIVCPNPCALFPSKRTKMIPSQFFNKVKNPNTTTPSSIANDGSDYDRKEFNNTSTKINGGVAGDKYGSTTTSASKDFGNNFPLPSVKLLAAMCNDTERLCEQVTSYLEDAIASTPCLIRDSEDAERTAKEEAYAKRKRMKRRDKEKEEEQNRKAGKKQNNDNLLATSSRSSSRRDHGKAEIVGGVVDIDEFVQSNNNEDDDDKDSTISSDSIESYFTFQSHLSQRVERLAEFFDVVISEATFLIAENIQHDLLRARTYRQLFSYTQWAKLLFYKSDTHSTMVTNDDHNLNEHDNSDGDEEDNISAQGCIGEVLLTYEDYLEEANDYDATTIDPAIESFQGAHNNSSNDSQQEGFALRSWLAVSHNQGYCRAQLVKELLNRIVQNYLRRLLASGLKPFVFKADEDRESSSSDSVGEEHDYDNEKNGNWYGSKKNDVNQERGVRIGGSASKAQSLLDPNHHSSKNETSSTNTSSFSTGQSALRRFSNMVKNAATAGANSLSGGGGGGVETIGGRRRKISAASKKKRRERERQKIRADRRALVSLSRERVLSCLSFHLLSVRSTLFIETRSNSSAQDDEEENRTNNFFSSPNLPPSDSKLASSRLPTSRIETNHKGIQKNPQKGFQGSESSQGSEGFPDREKTSLDSSLDCLEEVFVFQHGFSRKESHRGLVPKNNPGDMTGFDTIRSDTGLGDDKEYRNNEPGFTMYDGADDTGGDGFTNNGSSSSSSFGNNLASATTTRNNKNSTGSKFRKFINKGVDKLASLNKDLRSSLLGSSPLSIHRYRLGPSWLNCRGYEWWAVQGLRGLTFENVVDGILCNRSYMEKYFSSKRELAIFGITPKTVTGIFDPLDALARVLGYFGNWLNYGESSAAKTLTKLIHGLISFETTAAGREDNNRLDNYHQTTDKTRHRRQQPLTPKLLLQRRKERRRYLLNSAKRNLNPKPSGGGEKEKKRGKRNNHVFTLEGATLEFELEHLLLILLPRFGTLTPSILIHLLKIAGVLLVGNAMMDQSTVTTAPADKQPFNNFGSAGARGERCERIRKRMEIFLGLLFWSPVWKFYFGSNSIRDDNNGRSHRNLDAECLPLGVRGVEKRPRLRYALYKFDSALTHLVNCRP